MAVKRGGLGRGLSSLIPASQTATEEYLVEQGAEASKLSLSKITPNPDQPRRTFDKAKLEELASSIKEHGVLSPILVSKKGDHYEIIAGERRYRAAIMAGLMEVPVLIKDFTEKEILEVSLIENVQRENLNPIEEAAGYKRLSEEFSLTQEQIARRVGKSRVAVANAMRLLALPAEAEALVREGKLSAGQARTVLSLEDETKRSEFARYIAENALSVRECEALCKTFGKEKAPQDKPGKKAEKAPVDPDVRLVEEELCEKLSAKARILPGKKGAGKLVIEYYDVDGLNRILDLMGIGKRGF